MGYDRIDRSCHEGTVKIRWVPPDLLVVVLNESMQVHVCYSHRITWIDRCFILEVWGD